MLENMHFDSTGRKFIEGFEGCVLYIYDDKRAPVRGKYKQWKKSDGVVGTLTIGYGHTDAALYKLPFKLKDAPDGFSITEAQADEILATDLSECEGDVRKYVKVPIDQGMFNALGSFDFNCGCGNLKKLVEPLNRGDAARTRANFDFYIRSKGEVMRGLQRRRDGEQALWDNHSPAAVAAVIPAADEIVHHAAEVDAKPNVVVVGLKSRKVWAGVTAKVFAVGGICTKGFHDAISYFQPHPQMAADYLRNFDVQGFVGDVEPKINAGQQIAGWLDLNTAMISGVVIVGCLGYMVLRGSGDKQEALV